MARLVRIFNLISKWLSYEKYLVMGRDLKLKFYSFDLKILGKFRELIED